ncbi:receptor L domain-containing protein [Flavicella sediminum]|uniref:hypothetical protein n=1 Tax=Flavicella sediminum TaxID=2585141 RepID=UPI00112012F6|nr:hypothetical protein [Flavicella sediminum]
MKIQQLIFIFICFLFSKTTFASIGIADGPAIEYGLGPYGYIFIIIIASIMLFIELLTIIVLAVMKKKNVIFKILKINLIIIPIVILTLIIAPKIEQALSGDYIVHNQGELEEFGLDNLTKIKGHLLIAGVNDLTSLHNITEISGDLIIGFEEWDIYKKNQDLVSLKGLDNLKTIGGKLIIRDTSLTNLNGLDNLITVKNGIEIKHNNKLLNYCSIKNVLINTKTNITKNLFNPGIAELNSSNSCRKRE